MSLSKDLVVEVFQLVGDSDFIEAVVVKPSVYQELIDIAVPDAAGRTVAVLAVEGVLVLDHEPFAVKRLERQVTELKFLIALAAGILEQYPVNATTRDHVAQLLRDGVA